METRIDSLLTGNNYNEVVDTLTNLINSNSIDIIKSINELGNDKILGLPSNWFFLIAGALASLIFVLLYQEVFFLKKLFVYKYYSYKGFYIAYQKYNESNEDYFVELKRCRNQFLIKGISIKKNGNEYIKRNEPLTGKIVLSDSMPIYGNGYYQHKTDDQGKTRFGFLNIQLSEESILVSHTINNIDNKLVNPAYIWKKVKVKDYPELFEFYKKQHEI